MVLKRGQGLGRARDWLMPHNIGTEGQDRSFGIRHLLELDPHCALPDSTGLGQDICISGVLFLLSMFGMCLESRTAAITKWNICKAPDPSLTNYLLLSPPSPRSWE